MASGLARPYNAFSFKYLPIIINMNNLYDSKNNGWILGLARRLNARNAALAITGGSCVLSAAVYLLIGLTVREIKIAGIITSMVIPATIAPFLSYAFFKALVRMDTNEKALRKSEDNFNKLFKASPLPAVLSTFDDCVILAVNDSFIQELGYSEEETLGVSSLDLGFWPEKETREQGLSIIERDGRLRDFEISYRFKSGEVRRALWSAERIETEGQLRLLSVLNDITERKRAEEAFMQSERALRFSEEKFYKAFHASPTWVTITAMESGEYFDVNDTFLKGAGFEKSEVLGKTSHELGIWADIEERRKFVGKIDTEGFARNVEAQVRTKSGKILDMIFSGEKIELGGTQCILVTAQDITERKQAEEALRLSEEKYSKAFQGVPVWIVISTVDEGRYIEVNEAFLRATGFKREEIIGRTSLEVQTWPDPSSRTDIIKKLNTQGRVRNLEVRRKTKSGAILEMLFSAELIQIAGENYLLSISQDISELKEAEQKRADLEAQLLQAQKMEAIGTLAGGISHDFNNLLQAIQGYTELLLLETDARSRGFQELQQIRRATGRASDLTQQLLTFSRKVKSDFHSVDMNYEVEQIQKILDRTIPKNIEIKLNLADDLKPVKADPGQIEHLIMNMAVNARDAMPNGGVLTISTQNVSLDSEICAGTLDSNSGDYILLKISDTGCGMDKDTVGHIFEPFYTTKPIGQGTGLGLAMVFGIVKSHSGFIFCESQPGHGAKFSVYLPQSKEKPRNADQETQAASFSGSGVALIVDDEEFLRDLGKQILSRFGYTVLVEADGAKAIETYKKKHEEIDLIILDLMMPGMSGLACMDELLCINPEAKIVIASGFAADEQTKREIASKARGFIKKPFELSEIIEIVHELTHP